MAVDIAVSAKRGSKPIVFIEVPCGYFRFRASATRIQRGRWIALANENVALPDCALNPQTLDTVLLAEHPKAGPDRAHNIADLSSPGLSLPDGMLNGRRASLRYADLSC